MKRSHVVLFVAAVIVAMAVGAGIAMLASGQQTGRVAAAATTTVTVSAAREPAMTAVYLSSLQELGYAKDVTGIEAALSLADEHCAQLTGGMVKADILADLQHAPGTPERYEDEVVLVAAVNAFCPQFKPFISN